MAGYPLGDIRRVYLNPLPDIRKGTYNPLYIVGWGYHPLYIKKLERNILTEESTCGTMEIWKKALLL
jgi:hypothetical protein